MIYVIGDIHGMRDQLEGRLTAMCAHAASRGIARPRVVFLGDYIDRGPDSRGVLDVLTGPMMTEFDPVFLLGNHDLVLREIVKGSLPSFDWLVREGGWETMASYGDFRGRSMRDTAKGFCKVVPEAHARFLAELQLSWQADGLYFSHAGVNPGGTLDDQQQAALIYGDRDLFEHDHDALGPLLRQRLGARLVHGHYAARQVVVLPHRICVDTGAGYAAGRLSVVAIDGEYVEVLP